MYSIRFMSVGSSTVNRQWIITKITQLQSQISETISLHPNSLDNKRSMQFAGKHFGTSIGNWVSVVDSLTVHSFVG